MVIKNINQLLGNAWRSDLFGFNMASRGLKSFENRNRRPENRKEGATPLALWDKPQPGLQGILCLGHHVNVVDALTMKVKIDGKTTALHPVRNHWTPAFMDTVYRSDVDFTYYPNSGPISVRDRKAILQEDVFVSHLTFTNQKRENVMVEVELGMPFMELAEGIYEVNAQTAPKALKQSFSVSGYAAVLTDKGERKVCLQIPPLGRAKLRVSMAFDTKSRQNAIDKAKEVLNAVDPFLENEQAVNGWFAENVPVLECENQDILKIYYYRWFVVYRNIFEPSQWIEGHPISGKCIYESSYGGWFGTVIGLPIALQVGDAGWLRNSAVVKNQLKNWSNKTVAFQQYIQFTPLAAWRYYMLSRDQEWLSEVYQGFADYGKRLLKNSMPPITIGSWNTGAEYQPDFYQYTKEPWDFRYDEEGAREGFPKKALHRVDTVGFIILSLRGCINMAKELGESSDAECFSNAEKKLTRYLLENMWDSEKGFFYSVDPEVQKRCDEAACYDGFVPFIDLVAGEQYFGAFEKLWDEKWFWSEYGATTAARNCPMFWYDNCIAGPTACSVKKPHEYGCSWNGPVWPFANSLIALGFGEAATKRKDLQEHWLKFFQAYTELHFMYGDRSMPIICEHYRPDDGASFSQFTEYFHSSWIDLFMRFYAGISFEGEEPKFSPFAKEPFALYGVKLGEHYYDFVHTADGQNKVFKQ